MGSGKFCFFLFLEDSKTSSGKHLPLMFPPVTLSQESNYKQGFSLSAKALVSPTGG